MSNQNPPAGPPQGPPGQPGPYGPPQGQYQGGPGYYQGPPPKKSHTLRNVLLILGLLFILFIGGCVALIGTAANEIDKSLEEEAQNDRPTTVEVGNAFTHDGFEVADGWQTATEFGDVTLKNVRVTAAEADPDLPDEGRTALLTFRFYKGTEVLAEVECSTNEMQVGESSRANCVNLSGGKANGFDRISVSDLF